MAIPIPPVPSGTVADLMYGALEPYVIMSSANAGLAVKIGAQTNLSAYGSTLSVKNLGCRTGQLFINDYYTADSGSGYNWPIVQFSISGAAATPEIVFRDDGVTGADTYKFSQIEFLTGVQTTYNKVYVEAEGVTTQSATANPYATAGLTYNSANATNADALNLASYLAAIYQQTAPAPFSITTSTAVDGNAQKLAEYVTYPVGSSVKLVFRGTTFYATLQGSSSNFYPDYMSVTCFLSPSLGTPFILDSTNYGVLDTNRLGYP